MGQIFWILLLTISSGTIYGQTFNIEAAWRLNWAATVDSMDVAQAQNFSRISEHGRTDIERLFSGRQFSFNSNGEVVIRWNTPEGQASQRGNWLLNNDSLSITVEGFTTDYRVSVYNEHLLLERVSTPSNALFSILIFDKN